MAKKPAQKSVDFLVGDRKVKILVPDDIKAYFNSQFVRDNPTAGFKKRYATLKNLMRLAYSQGMTDALSGKSRDTDDSK